MKAYMIGNLDGENSALVAAKSQKEACRLMGVSLGNFRVDGQRLPDDHKFAAIALASPGTVFKRSIVGALVKDYDAQWRSKAV